MDFEKVCFDSKAEARIGVKISRPRICSDNSGDEVSYDLLCGRCATRLGLWLINGCRSPPLGTLEAVRMSGRGTSLIPIPLSLHRGSLRPTVIKASPPSGMLTFCIASLLRSGIWWRGKSRVGSYKNKFLSFFIFFLVCFNSVRPFFEGVIRAEKWGRISK